MHEYVVTEQVVRIVLEEAAKAGLRAVRRVELTLGRLRGFMPDAIRLYFQLLSDGTPAQGAELLFTEVDARFRCRSCGLTFTLDTPAFVCPSCESLLLDTLSGEEFTIDAVEGDPASASR